MGIIQLFNAETGQTTWVNSSSAKAQELHKKNFEDFEEQLNKEFKKYGIDCATISTEEDFINYFEDHTNEIILHRATCYDNL